MTEFSRSVVLDLYSGRMRDAHGLHLDLLRGMGWLQICSLDPDFRPSPVFTVHSQG